MACSSVAGILSHLLLDYVFESGIIFTESGQKLAERIFAAAGFLLLKFFLL